MLQPSDYAITVDTSTVPTTEQLRFELFALLHKAAADNLNEQRIFSKYAYDKVIEADPTQASLYASYIPTVPTVASIITDANALFTYILELPVETPAQ